MKNVENKKNSNLVSHNCTSQNKNF